jgi:hypothetical protein
MTDNVIPIRGHFMTKEEREAYERPELVLDPATGLYSIVVAGVAVYEGLDPISLREAIRREAAGHVQSDSKDGGNG